MTKNIKDFMCVNTGAFHNLGAGMGITPAISDKFRDYIETDTTLSLHALEQRRYTIIDDIKPQEFNPRQSW